MMPNVMFATICILQLIRPSSFNNKALFNFLINNKGITADLYNITTWRYSLKLNVQETLPGSYNHNFNSSNSLYHYHCKTFRKIARLNDFKMPTAMQRDPNLHR